MIPVPDQITASINERRISAKLMIVRKLAQASLTGGFCFAVALAVLAAPPARAQVDTDGSFEGLTINQRAYVRRYILRHLREPKRARIRSVHVVRDVFGWRGSWALCGEIAEGDRGQHQTYEPFLIAPQGDDPWPIVRNPVADRPAERNRSRIAAAKACAEAVSVSVGPAVR